MWLRDRCGPEWPTSTGRLTSGSAQEIPTLGSEACKVEAEPCGYVQSCVGRGPQLIDYSRKNRKGRATWDKQKNRPR